MRKRKIKRQLKNTPLIYSVPSSETNGTPLTYLHKSTASLPTLVAMAHRFNMSRIDTTLSRALYCTVAILYCAVLRMFKIN